MSDSFLCNYQLIAIIANLGEDAQGSQIQTGTVVFFCNNHLDHMSMYSKRKK